MYMLNLDKESGREHNGQIQQQANLAMGTVEAVCYRCKLVQVEYGQIWMNVLNVRS